ncbi:MAG: DUF1800 domain-containing protein [Granulosicoccus sp.]|nr:DUF1800 domain-containing protein [Granulosicoccus sp.]
MKIIIKLLLPIVLLGVQACSDGGFESALYERELAAAPALPATEVANAAPGGPTSEAEAFRLLEQATFGPNRAEIQLAAEIGPEIWINEQVRSDATFMLPALYNSRQDRWNEYVNIWWRHAVKGDDQLRQRVAFALSQILVVSATDGLSEEQPGLANYYDLLIQHAFGNYRDLLEDVTLNPIMGEYLSMKGNRKPDVEENIRPDENYAREILQLFTIGTELLHPDGTPQLGNNGVPKPAYSQEHIEAFAHVFTGWHFANADDFRWPQNKDYLSPMEAWPEYHDTGEKVLLRGRVLPAGQSPEQDLSDALDNLFNHPNVGPFISKQLIQRLVTSNPSPGYVKDVAAVFDRNAQGERGSLASTVKAILMHEEARSGHLESPETFGKLKEPTIRITQVWRAFEPRYIHENFNYGWAQNEIAQAPLNSPSVFNFYRPDYSQPGDIENRGLVSPEFGIVDESSIIALTSRLLANTLWSHNYKNDSDSQRIAIDITDEMQLEPDRDALIDHLDMLLLGGTMSEPLRAQVNALMNERSYDDAASQRVVEAIFLIVTSPEAAVQI